MSANKTQNFGLHVWEGGDDFLRSEFNENFAALDGAARVSAGAYVGNGNAERIIELGFTPTIVLVLRYDGAMLHNGDYYGGLSTVEAPAWGVLDASLMPNIVTICEVGFKVYQRKTAMAVYTNYSGTEFHYLAFR